MSRVNDSMKLFYSCVARWLSSVSASARILRCLRFNLHRASTMEMCFVYRRPSAINLSFSVVRLPSESPKGIPERLSRMWSWLEFLIDSWKEWMSDLLIDCSFEKSNSMKSFDFS